ncbi:c-type cytochrome [Cupriavidus alkaliphilus]|uniref:c-type cytochrome n=1 Tax=Cupriavidus alkaliphilus TaxID=942866 RepID=UPI00160AE855|nr:c-type cytochrome [Cupriavidus alkaliphilus]MBB3014094.1 cytochrome c [Cupriavidus alkaliphilus]
MNQLFSALVLAPAMLASVSAKASSELAQQKNCMACHAVGQKFAGPAFKDVAGRYANQSGAWEMLAERNRKGGVGTWGAILMPPNPQVNAEEARQLAQWVLSLK